MDYPKENEGKIIDKNGENIDPPYANYNIVKPNLADYRKVEKPEFTYQYIQGETAYNDQYIFYDFSVVKKQFDSVKTLFDKLKETPVLYLPPKDTLKTLVFQSKSAYVLMMPIPAN